MIKFAEFIVYAGILIVTCVLIFIATRDHIDAVPDPIEYGACTSLDSFDTIITRFDGKILAGGPVISGHIMVVLYPDNSFLVVVYRDTTDDVCVIDTGWFIENLNVPNRPPEPHVPDGAIEPFTDNAA